MDLDSAAVFQFMAEDVLGQLSWNQRHGSIACRHEGVVPVQMQVQPLCRLQTSASLFVSGLPPGTSNVNHTSHAALWLCYSPSRF